VVVVDGEPLERGMGRGEILRTHGKALRTGDQIGFVREQECERRGEHGGFVGTRAQIGRGQAGHVEQALRPVGIRERPDQRLQRKLRRIIARIIARIIVCQRGAHCVFIRPMVEESVGVAKRVLVVEDNELNLKLFRDLLEAHEYLTEGVRDGREAVVRARDFRPDLIVMDIQLPHVSGYDLILQLKADPALCDIPVMAVTAYAGREDEERIRAAGADAYVSKPISLVRFVDTVTALL